MDNTDRVKKILLYRKKKNPDGSVTVDIKQKQRKKRKVVIARGKGEHTVGNILASQLEPFRPAMVQGLNKRGYNTAGVSFRDIISLYYNEFVSNQENKSNPFVPVNRFEFRNNPAWKIRPSDNLNGDITDHRNREYFTEIDTIVNNIVSIFAESKKKYDESVLSGVDPHESLTAEEIHQAKAARKVERILENKLTGSEPVTWGGLLKMSFWILCIYLVLQFLSA